MALQHKFASILIFLAIITLIACDSGLYFMILPGDSKCFSHNVVKGNPITMIYSYEFENPTNNTYSGSSNNNVTVSVRDASKVEVATSSGKVGENMMMWTPSDDGPHSICFSAEQGMRWMRGKRRIKISMSFEGTNDNNPTQDLRMKSVETSLGRVHIKTSYIQSAQEQASARHEKQAGSSKAARTGRMELYLCTSEGKERTEIWDFKSNIPLITYKDAFVRSGASCIHGNYLITAHPTKAVIHIHKLDKSTPLYRCPCPSVVTCVTASKNILYAGTKKGDIIVWCLLTGEQYGTFRAHSRSISRIAVSPDSSFLCSGADDGVVNIWSISQILGANSFSDSFHCLFVCLDHTLPIRSIVFVETSNEHSCCFLTCSLDRSIRMYDTRSIIASDRVSSASSSLISSSSTPSHRRLHPTASIHTPFAPLCMSLAAFSLCVGSHDGGCMLYDLSRKEGTFFAAHVILEGTIIKRKDQASSSSSSSSSSSASSSAPISHTITPPVSSCCVSSDSLMLLIGRASGEIEQVDICVNSVVKRVREDSSRTESRRDSSEKNPVDFAVTDIHSLPHLPHFFSISDRSEAEIHVHEQSSILSATPLSLAPSLSTCAQLMKNPTKKKAQTPCVVGFSAIPDIARYGDDSSLDAMMDHLVKRMKHRDTMKLKRDLEGKGSSTASDWKETQYEEELKVMLAQLKQREKSEGILAVYQKK
ncbi:hypothetical protein ADUPG1_006550 [Aduncisulcus paluster]|uniref:GOLD domain-containing protein n=1 Tax=Aduncisulcus paluster TaxID=2918883 RepID=A0ABQ5KKD8_9EUKA|nr:hypothetical protein ADUPG1_006550 [Aduncisulcus paluster]